MKYRKMGRTGIMVSEFSFGCMNFGGSTQQQDAIEIVQRAHELGINHFDTCDRYPIMPGKEIPFGLSEQILGKAVKSFRKEILITTKGGGKVGERPNDEGLSRLHIMHTVENSLRNLQTDYIDLYMAHTLDPWTPVDETLRAFDDLVHSGKVRYVGCSNFDAWQMCKALWFSDTHNLTPFNFTQIRYNLIARAVENELLPFCASERLGVFAYNPLAGGLLAGGLYDRGGKLLSSYAKGAALPKGGRFLVPGYRTRYWHDWSLDAVEKLQDIAQTHGHTPAQAALGWLLSKPVTSVLMSADFVDQLERNVATLDISMSDDEIKSCDEVYEGMLPAGWSAQEGGDIRRQWKV